MAKWSGTGGGGAHPVLLGLLVLLTPVFWLALVATTNRHELAVGAASSVATLVFTVFVCRSSSTRLVLRARDVAQCRRIPWYIVSGVWEITVVLVKDVLGVSRAKNLYRACGFDSGARDPVKMARTVLAVAYTTAAPNFIVVGVDASQSRMLFHQIEASGVQRMTKALGGKG